MFAKSSLVPFARGEEMAFSGTSLFVEEGERTERSLQPLIADLVLPEPSRKGIIIRGLPFLRFDEEEATCVAPPARPLPVLDSATEVAFPAVRRRRSRSQWIGGALSVLIAAGVAAGLISLEVDRLDQERIALLSENEELRTGKIELAQRVRTLDGHLEHAALALEARRSILEFIPVEVPVDAVTTSGFGVRRDPFSARVKHHDGVDYGAPRGTPVTATADGRIAHAGPRGTYGNLVQIDHGDGLSTRYAHLSKVLVQPGDEVKRGQVVGHVGSTGKSTAPHLHYEVWADDRPLDPAFLMRVWAKLSGSIATAQEPAVSTTDGPSS